MTPPSSASKAVSRRISKSPHRQNPCRRSSGAFGRQRPGETGDLIEREEDGELDPHCDGAAFVVVLVPDLCSLCEEAQSACAAEGTSSGA